MVLGGGVSCLVDRVWGVEGREPAVSMDHDSPHDAKHPRGAPTAPPQPGQGAEGTEAHLLGEVVGVVPVAQMGTQPSYVGLGNPDHVLRCRIVAGPRGEDRAGPVAHGPGGRARIGGSRAARRDPRTCWRVTDGPIPCLG